MTFKNQAVFIDCVPYQLTAAKLKPEPLFGRKEFNNRKQAEFAPHKSSCIAINNGLYPADMVTEY